MKPSLLSRFFLRARIWSTLPAVIFCLCQLQAQPAGSEVRGRWLLIFDTSSDMKPRLRSVQVEVETLCASSMSGQIQSGDSIGVWTFGEALRTGEFPLLYWAPEKAVSIAESINKFVKKQHYTKSTRFAVLQPLLNQVVRDSPRLTVLIFCDGDGALTGTRYDDGINRLMQQRKAQQKKARQPLVIVLRSQLGQYVGCTMNFPPGMVRLPDFPPLPPPPASPAAAPQKPAPPPSPPPTAPPLIIVGTNVETGSSPTASPVPAIPAKPTPAPPTNTIAAVTSTPPVTNPVTPSVASAPAAGPTNATEAAPPLASTNASSPARPAEETNVVSAPPKIRTAPPPVPAPAAAPETNRVEAANAGTPKNGLARSPTGSNSNHHGALALGAGLLLAAAALVAFAFFRTRRRADRGSLITRTMPRK